MMSEGFTTMAVREVCTEFNTLRDVHGNDLFFYQYPFSAKVNANELGRELANLIWNENFRSDHVPAFLRYTCLMQRDWQGDFWRAFAAPELAALCGASAESFYITVFQTDDYWFFAAFREWCRETAFKDSTLWEIYTNGGRDFSNWRVRLVQDQAGLLRDNRLTESFFNGMRLWELPSFDNQYFATRFDRLIGQQDTQTSSSWSLRSHFMIDLGENLARLAANISFPPTGGALDAEQVDHQARTKAADLGFSDVMLVRLSSIYRFLDLAPPPSLSRLNPNYRIDFSGVPYSGVAEIGDSIRPCLLGYQGGPLRVEICNLQPGLQVEFAIHTSSNSIRCGGQHFQGAKWTLSQGLGNRITGFDYWDNLTLVATVPNHPGIKIHPKNFNWIAPGLFRRTMANNGGQFFKRIARDSVAFIALGETMLLVPETQGGQPNINPATAAIAIAQADGTFKISISNHLTAIPDNTITITSGSETWEFRVAVPSATIRVEPGHVHKIVGYRVNNDDGDQAIVFERNTVPNFQITPRLPDGWCDTDGGQIGNDGFLVVMDGWGPKAQELMRQPIPGLFSPDTSQVGNQPVPKQVALGPVPTKCSEFLTLAVEDSQQRRIGSQFPLMLVHLGTRCPNQSLAIFRAKSVQLVDCFANPDSIHIRGIAYNVVEGTTTVRDTAIVTISNQSVRLSGFKTYPVTGVSLLNFPDVGPEWSIQDLDDWLAGWMPIGGNFIIASTSGDDAELSLVSPDRKTALNLRVMANRIDDGFKNYSFLDFHHGLVDAQIDERLRSLLSFDKFTIEFRSKHISPAIPLLTVRNRPVITGAISFHGYRRDNQHVWEAVVTLDCHHPGIGSSIILEHWTVGDGLAGLLSSTAQLTNQQAPQIISSSTALPPLDLGSLGVGNRQFRLLWKAHSGKTVELQSGSFTTATLSHLNTLILIAQDLDAAWVSLIGSPDWLRAGLSELSQLVENALQCGISITNIMDHFQNNQNSNWPYRAINYISAMLPVNHGPLYKWARDIGKNIGHPNNPVGLPYKLGLGQNSDRSLALLAAALIAAHLKLFQNAGHLMFLDAQAVRSWVDLLNFWHGRDGGNHLAEVSGFLNQSIDGSP